MIKVNGAEIKPTIFPDGTSQVWKLDDGILASRTMHIEFEFENEAEIFQLQQLNTLIHYGRVPHQITLHMPYLPYGRQDKEVSNETTFALRTFAKIINRMRFQKVTTLDAHSSIAAELFNNFESIYPEQEIKTAHDNVSSGDTATIAFPDDGAYKRYHTSAEHRIIGHKVRDQKTGWITSYNIEGNPDGKTILIVDDICDGGMTFKLMAKELYKQGAESVHLYVTHGIFSKGLSTLRSVGINRIFTKDGEV